MIREEIWRCLAALKAAGQTILVVDKYVHRLMDLADRHLILERGRLVWEGTLPRSMPTAACGSAIWRCEARVLWLICY